MVFSSKKKHQIRKQSNQLDKTLNNFIIGIITNAGAIPSEIMEPHTGNLASKF